MISIIVPTLNEEKYLPLLLESIRKQSFSDFEIIVADAGSKDDTLDIARRNGLFVVSGGLPGKGKNSGADSANGDVLLFLDADTSLSEDFLEKSFGEFQKRKLDIAGFCLLPIKKNKINYFLFQYLYNFPIMGLEKILPHAAAGIMIRKKFFERTHGFDEDIKIAEDHDLARRGIKFGKYGIIKSAKVFVSDRRFKQDGWLETFSKYVFCELHMIFLGPVKSDIFKYKFGHYKNGRSS